MSSRSGGVRPIPGAEPYPHDVPEGRDVPEPGTNARPSKGGLPRISSSFFLRLPRSYRVPIASATGHYSSPSPACTPATATATRAPSLRPARQPLRLVPRPTTMGGAQNCPYPRPHELAGVRTLLPLVPIGRSGRASCLRALTGNSTAPGPRRPRPTQSAPTSQARTSRGPRDRRLGPWTYSLSP